MAELLDQEPYTASPLHGSASAELMPAIVAHDGQVHLSRWPRYRTQCAPMTETR